MKRLTPQAIAALVALALLAVVAVFTAPPQAPPREEYVSTDYGASGYRAWVTLLGHEGVVTERFVLRPIELDDRIDTLVSAQPTATAGQLGARTAADLAALAGWVQAGGRLIYLGRNSALSATETQTLKLPFWLPAVGRRGRASGALIRSVGSVATIGADRMLLVEHAGNAELSDRNGDIVVRYPLGRGEVVAVSDPRPFTNANIAAAGNARLAYLLSRPRRSGGVVAFDDGIHGALIDRPWYRALPVPVRVGLGILAFAVLLGLIGGALRSAPPMATVEPREPTSLEFIAALAALHERIGSRSAAVAVLARDALAVAGRGNGASERVAPADLAARLPQLRQADEIRALGDLLTASIQSDAELVAGARLAHSVRKEWTHGGYGDRRRAAFAGRTRSSRRR